MNKLLVMMANNGKGAYWVSENEPITNPYFGKRMLKCGTTKETLLAKEIISQLTGVIRKRS